MLSPFKQFVTDIQQWGLEKLGKYYGPYRALVVNNADPLGLGRVQVACPRALLSPTNGVWLYPMMIGGGDKQGIFWPPVEGETVYIYFDNGDPTMPFCYFGGWHKKEEVHPDLRPETEFDTEGNEVYTSPTRRGLVTPGGHRIVLDDTDGGEQVTIEHVNGRILQMTSGGKVRMGDKDGDFEPMLRGSTVKQWMESHSHPHSWGPTGTPIQPFPINGLSDDTETT